MTFRTDPPVRRDPHPADRSLPVGVLAVPAVVLGALALAGAPAGTGGPLAPAPLCAPDPDDHRSGDDTPGRVAADSPCR